MRNISKSNIIIRKADKGDIRKTARFIRFMVKENFKGRYSWFYRCRIKNSLKRYFNDSDSALFIAETRNKKIIACAAVRRYEGKLDELKNRKETERIIEFERFYVLKQYRRQGLASTLVETCEEFCRENGYNHVKLHTHHFLEGAVRFWLKNGYSVVKQVHNSWQTVFMEKSITN